MSVWGSSNGGGSNIVVSESTFSSSAVYVDLEKSNPPYTVSIYPGSGCSCLVQTCTRVGAATSDPGASFWEDWSQGAVSSTATVYVNAPISALKITRVSGSATCNYTVRSS